MQFVSRVLCASIDPGTHRTRRISIFWLQILPSGAQAPALPSAYHLPGADLLTAGGAVAYLLSCIAQYGHGLHGPAGFAVPVGVPLILTVAGYVMMVEDDDEQEYEGEEEGYGEEETDGEE